MIAEQFQANLMRKLIEKSEETVNALPGENDEVTAARVQLLTVLSVAYISIDSVSTALRFAEQAELIATTLIQKRPDFRPYIHHHATAQSRLAEALFLRGELDRAIEVARQAKGVLVSLASSSINDEELQWEVIKSHEQVGDIYRARGDFGESASEYKAWLELSDRLQKEHPRSSRWLRAKGFAIQRMGDNALI